MNCNCSMFNNDDLNNTPLDIPDYVLYGMLHTNKGYYITIIDMEKDSIVGYYRVSKKDEFIDDFCIRNDNFYVTMSFTDMFGPIGPTGGNDIKVISSEFGTEIGNIETASSPSSIFVLPNNKAFVFHYFIESGDSAMTNSIIDLDKKTVIKKIISNLGGPGYQEMFTSPNNDIWIFSDSPKSEDTYIIKFVEGPDTLGNRVLLEQEYNGMILEPSLAKFVSENKVYAICYAQSGIAVYDFPSGKVKNFISVEKGSESMLPLPNGKVYISHFDYSCNDGSDNHITVIDANSDAVINEINVCSGPFYITYSKTLNKVYVGSVHENCIAVIDPNTDSLIKIIKGETIGSDKNGYLRLIPSK